MTNIFEIDKQVISDSSEVFNLLAVDKTWPASVTIWTAPTERTAAQCAMTLNDVMEAFAGCGSDNEVIRLANRIFEACKPQ